jgi:hypothetical protein
MAINKVINKSTKSHGAMRNVLEYVLRGEKVKEGHTFIAGPYAGDTINYDEVYQTWIKEKQLWNKDSGRMYAHNIISFHKDEKVSPAEVLKIGITFSEKFFPKHQYVVSVHQDKDHLHCHIVTNSVSYIDGSKLHQTKRDLERQKRFTNSLCCEHGLTVAEKGRHFDGTAMEQGEVTAWSKDKYNLFLNDSKKSYVLDCAIAVLEVVPQSKSREEFISGMINRGWTVEWEDHRKHIVFRNNDGKKVRDSNLEKTFAGLEVNKEALTHEFERQNELRNSALKVARDSANDDLRQYYAEIESAAAGLDSAETVRNNTKTNERNTATYQYDFGNAVTDGQYNTGTGSSEETGQTFGYRSDTDTLIREIRTDISDSRSQSRIVIRTENQSVVDEKQSITDAEQRRFEEQRRAEESKRTKTTRRKVPLSHGWER